MDILFSIFISIATSALVSCFFWLYPLRKIVPKIQFSEEVAEYELEDSESFFQCAFRNVGRRSIIDINITVLIGIKEYMNASGWAYHTLTTNGQKIPQLNPNERRKVRIYDTREGSNFIGHPSISLKKTILDCHSLRDVLKLGTDANVCVHVFGYDEYSGVRKHFCSPKYRLSDIRIGTFDKDELNVVENTRFKPKWRRRFLQT